MEKRPLYVLVGAVGAAAVAAIFSSPAADAGSAVAARRDELTRTGPWQAEEPGSALPPGHPPVDTADERSIGESLPPGHPKTGESLPPGHPPVDSLLPPAADEPNVAPLQWTVFETWRRVDNPNSMRLATYRLPRESADTEEPELSVTAAGGTLDGNIERWIGQFDPAGKRDVQQEKREVGGLRVRVVAIRGTYLAGTMGSGEGKKPNFGLLGAVVEAPSTLMFFKMTGPAAAVDKQRTGFDALLKSLVVTPGRTL